MNLFRLFKKSAWMPLAVVPLLVGCQPEWFDKVIDGYDMITYEFASDTTAVLLKQYWSGTEENCGLATCWGGIGDKDLELQLVDVRFKKVYWSSGKVRNNGCSGSARQWNDSTVFIEGDTDNHCLWVIGSPRPRKINLNWNMERKRLIYFSYKWLRLKKDSILIYNSTENIIIDTKVRTVSNWNPPDEYKWVVTLNGNNFWWGEVAGGGYLLNDKDSCRFSLLSEKGDTLSNVVYFNNCEHIYGRNGSGVYIESYFIRVSSPVDKNDDYYYWPADYALFRYDEEGNIAQKPSFWVNYIIKKRDEKYFANMEFVDSLGKIMEY